MTKQIELKPHPRNDDTRKIGKAAATGLAASMRRWGNLAGITWNKRNGYLVAGHRRVEQIKELGGQLMQDPLRFEISVQGKRKTFPVEVVDLPEGEHLAAMVAANNRHIAGEFTDGMDDLLPEIASGMPDDDWGELKFDSLAKDLKIKMGPDIEEDEVPEPPKNPVTKAGDVWMLGGHTVVCGDSRESYEIGAKMGCVVTDPPYGVSYQSRIAEKRRKDWGEIEGDDLRGDGLVSMLRETVPSGVFRYVFCPWETFAEFTTALGKPRSVCVWDKGHFGLGKGYRRQFELVLFYGKLNRTDLADMWPVSRSGDYKHPTQKPVAVVAKPIEDCGATEIYDPFLGSGTTLIAAEQLGRKCYGIEIEPAYVDVCVERWENLTGGKATRKKA